MKIHTTFHNQISYWVSLSTCQRRLPSIRKMGQSQKLRSNLDQPLLQPGICPHFKAYEAPQILSSLLRIDYLYFQLSFQLVHLSFPDIGTSFLPFQQFRRYPMDINGFRDKFEASEKFSDFLDQGKSFFYVSYFNLCLRLIVQIAYNHDDYIKHDQSSYNGSYNEKSSLLM